MNGVSQFRTVAPWSEALGLLPVPLRETSERQTQYVLMNGNSGNFCLDFSGDLNPADQRSTAWSCDVGHYVTCLNDYIVVTRWNRESREQRYSCRSVLRQLHEFHRHLESAASDRSQSIIAHVLRVFRRIRAVETDSVRSLRVLLHLMASAAAGRDRLSSGNDLEPFGLTPEMIEPSQGINEGTWSSLYNDLRGVGRYETLKPDFELLLRHASGTVFQDAHLEATNTSPTLWLPGFEVPVTVDARATPTETGIYFTPPALARTLAEEATRNIPNDADITLFDPACGSGELLKECLRLLKLRGYNGRVQVIGWDKSPVAVDMARFVLAWEKRAWIDDTMSIAIQRHDSINTAGWPQDIDILVMNPPFKSWQQMEPEEQAAVTAIVGASGKPNLAMAFARRGLSVLRQSGTLAMITPNSLLEADSGRETRQAMADALDPLLVARLGDQSYFSRALVDAGMYVGRRKAIVEDVADLPPINVPLPTRETAILWADSHDNSLNRALRGLRRWRGAQSEPINESGFSVYSASDIGTTGDSWAARRYDAWSMFRRFRNSDRLVPANQVFDIKQGSRLGNDVFIITRDYFNSLRKAEQKFFRPAVMNPSISDGRVHLADYVFYPYGKVPSIGTESDLSRYVPKYYAECLLPAKPALEKRKTLARQTELNWWDLLWPRAWQMESSPKLVSKYFGGPHSFAFDSTGKFVVVVGNAWLLKKGTVDLGITDAEVYYAILAYMNSSIAYDLLEYMSVQVAGGQLDLSNKYIGDVPILNLATLEPLELTELILRGTQISAAKQFDGWSKVDNRVASILSR